MWLLESSSGIDLTEPSDALAALQFDEQKSRAQAGLVPTFAGWIAGWGKHIGRYLRFANFLLNTWDL